MGTKTEIGVVEQQDLPLWADQFMDLEKKQQPLAGQASHVEEQISFDGQSYRYRGLVFTIDEAGVLLDCPLGRIKAMVNATYADPVRRSEISRFGKRAWHSRVRPESAASQALDYAFCHDVGPVARYLPYVAAFFEGDPSRADAWTLELKQAYARRKIDREPARRLLEEAGVPFRK